MEPNRKAHPECTHASNPYHECASACLERIAQGKGRKDTKKQASKVLSISRSFGKKNKEPESRPKPHQNGSFSKTNNPANDPLMTPSRAPPRKLEPEKKESFSSHSSEEKPQDLYKRDDSFNQKQNQFSGPIPPSPNNMHDHGGAATTKPNEHDITIEKSNATVEKNDAAEDTRSFSFLSPPRTHDDDENDDDDDNDEAEVESVISESCVSVGKYHVRSTVSSILKSIIDKHGDIAANCSLLSASMRDRYLECLCSVVQELNLTAFDHLTKDKAQEMLAVLKDLESANIQVDWLRRVLDELLEAVEFKNQHREKERRDRLLENMRAELESHEEALAKKEIELAEARARVDETRARLSELEIEQSRMNGVESKVEKFRGQSYIDELL